jgi:hypothetical protein
MLSNRPANEFFT